MARILLVDDHAIVRESFKRLIERDADMSVIGEAASCLDALNLLAQHAPDLLITDLSLADGTGMALLRDARQRHSGTRCIVLSMHDNPAFVAEALSLGADGYVTKGAGTDEISLCIRHVLAGERYLSKDLHATTSEAITPLGELTARERDALRLMVRGVAPKAAAIELGISDKTFYAHRASLLDKLGARNDRDLARIALDRGLI